MAITVPSRFAVLSIDDDDFKPIKIKKSCTIAKTNDKKKVSEKPSKQQPKKDEKKKQNKKPKKKSTNSEEQQWEEWKQKDSMAIEETYEQELHHAILLSKLSYEAQLENNAKMLKEQEQNKKQKKPKKSTMSLEEFNNMDSNISRHNSVEKNDCDNRLKESKAEFFERVDKEVTREIKKGKEKETFKARLNQLDDNITSAQLKVEIEKRDELIKQLREENESLKKEIAEVKYRNKKLYTIMCQGEMKEKAMVLAEVTKLKEIRDELTSTVDTLRIELEQERSKTRASNVDSKSTKQSNKKRASANENT